MFTVMIAAVIALVIGFVVISYLTSQIISDLAGAPYVPLDEKDLAAIFQHLQVRKTDVFVDLGSGDGRVVRNFVRTFNIPGIGVEINPLLVTYSQILSGLEKTAHPRFVFRNFRSFPLTRASIVFMYLFPRTAADLGPKIQAECPPGARVISVAFSIPRLNHLLLYTFPTPTGKMVFLYQLPA